MEGWGKGQEIYIFSNQFHRIIKLSILIITKQWIWTRLLRSVSLMVGFFLLKMHIWPFMQPIKCIESCTPKLCAGNINMQKLCIIIIAQVDSLGFRTHMNQEARREKKVK